MTESHQNNRNLTERYTATDGVVHMTGIHALARLPLDLRRRDLQADHHSAVFISGYEGSPLGGYDLELLRVRGLLNELEVVFQPGLNEELAATAVQGAQLAGTMADKRVDGVTGLWYGKSPGLDRASDAIRHANLSGTHPAGGAVALVGDDPTAKSSTVPGASEMLLADLGLPTFYPATPQEVLDYGLHAVAMSRLSGLWTALKIVTSVADGSGTVDVDPDRLDITLPDTVVDGTAHQHAVTAKMSGPVLATLERSRGGARIEMARRYLTANHLNHVYGADGSQKPARIGLVTAGKVHNDLVQALTSLGLGSEALADNGIRVLKLGVIFPLDPDEIRNFADGLAEIVVVEEKRSFLEAAIKDLLYGTVRPPMVVGKRDEAGAPLFSEVGELDPDQIAAGLRKRLARQPELAALVRANAQPGSEHRRRLLPLAVRTPYFCSGCPHNTSTKVPDGSLVGGGIGCHGLALLMAPTLVGEITGLTQMGGEGAHWIGMAPFIERDHLIQNLGDGTFHHSGSLAIRAAVAAGSHLTYKLLYNSAVAMTGGQQAVGQMSVAEIATAAAAEGVSRTIITTENPKSYRKVKLPANATVWHRDRLIAAQETLATTAGVTLLIHDQECATELRRKRKRGLAVDPSARVVINERICEGCGDCGVASNCLSVQPVETKYGRKTRIDQSSCNKDYSCLKGDCPSFMTVTPATAPGRRATARRIVDALRESDLPVPEFRHDVAITPHTTRILGIGGSGVVTLSQILSVAATNAGLHVVSLDQTGLAQKGGAVISDIKISARPVEIANKAAAGEVDLYLGADLLVAADPANLRAARPGGTVAVVATDLVPTGRMVSDVHQKFPETDLLTNRVRAAVAAEDMLVCDVRKASVALFGTDQFANLVLAGAAYQKGALPLPASAIEGAVELNGTKAKENIQAFRRGRQMAADPAAFAEAVGSVATETHPTLTSRAQRVAELVDTDADSTLGRLVRDRVRDLVDYQDDRYARRYAEFVESVRRQEAQRIPGSERFTETVAHHLHKLMAYKDEYEVARLALDAEVRASVEDEFGGGAKVAHHLHPPVLKSLGMHRKLRLRHSSVPVFRALRGMRRLRGTPLDVFGYAHVRKVERELVEEYTRVITTLAPDLDCERLDRSVAIAALPDQVRGYEQIKLANVETYRKDLARSLEDLTTPAHA
ncbi:indolepyruvate ferredoxin oxidoreductase family protein [Streptomyces sp. R39]|uniref:Indolepyruvate ferredoxin oxidoreductase family protein n=1 Tax=Streptomyces sp. R39 TaxID=3238631 RepID=A0AB39QIV2_9ACTN